MTDAFFPDNTVLCNFGAVDRVDLLRSVLGERGRWTEAVAYEASRSAAHLRALTSLAADGWLANQSRSPLTRTSRRSSGSGALHSAAPTTGRSSISARLRPAT